MVAGLLAQVADIDGWICLGSIAVLLLGFVGVPLLIVFFVRWLGADITKSDKDDHA